MARSEICLYCDREVKYKTAQMCARCYSRVNRQLQLGVTWMVERLQTYRMWEGTTSSLLRDEGVSTMPATRKKTKRRRRAA